MEDKHIVCKRCLLADIPDAAERSANIQEIIRFLREGINAGCTTVGIVKGSALLGISQSEYDAMSRTEIESYHGKVKDAYLNAGASFVIHSLAQLPKLLECLACNDRVNVRFYAV